jgi:hypothetical protein
MNLLSVDELLFDIVPTPTFGGEMIGHHVYISRNRD